MLLFLLINPRVLKEPFQVKLTQTDSSLKKKIPLAGCLLCSFTQDQLALLVIVVYYISIFFHSLSDIISRSSISLNNKSDILLVRFGNTTASL